MVPNFKIFFPFLGFSNGTLRRGGKLLNRSWSTTQSFRGFFHLTLVWISLQNVGLPHHCAAKRTCGYITQNNFFMNFFLGKYYPVKPRHNVGDPLCFFSFLDNVIRGYRDMDGPDHLVQFKSVWPMFSLSGPYLFINQPLHGPNQVGCD